MTAILTLAAWAAFSLMAGVCFSYHRALKRYERMLDEAHDGWQRSMDTVDRLDELLTKERIWRQQ